MTSINLETLFTIIYVLVDDWYQATEQVAAGKPGVAATLTDSEVLTLMVAHDYIPYPGERQYMGYMRANHPGLFPHLLDQSQYHRRSRQLQRTLEALRQHWVSLLVGSDTQMLLLDTKPIPVVGMKRSKKQSDFAGSAAYGYCAARQMKYFGYKLVMLTTLEGVPLIYDLVAANLGEREAATAVLLRVQHRLILGDKGFIGVEWQREMQEATHNTVLTHKRHNQVEQNPSAFDRLLGKFRERIETTFHQIQNTGRNVERLLAKTIEGLTTRVVQKVTALVLRLLLRRDFGIDVQSFQILPF